MDNYTTDLDEHDSEEGVVIEHPRIPEGDYLVRYLSHELHKKYHGFGDKLVIEFVITDGDYQGITLLAFYNVTITKNGFTVRGASRYQREMRQLFPAPRSNYPLRLLKDKTILAAGRTVTHGKGKRLLSKDEQYSVIEKLIQIIETVEK